jgi:GT2 family glycosyltransferase
MPIWVSTESDHKSAGAAAWYPTSQGALLLLLSAPVDWFVFTALLGAELIGRLWRRIAPRTPPAFSPCRPECSFVILSWNSQSMLAESLPPLLEAVQKYGGKHEIIVVDNDSTDGTGEYIKGHFPEVRLVSSRENLYFGAGTRLGIEAAKHDVLVLMNSDTIVRPGFLAPLVAALRDPATFGVASQVLAQGQPSPSPETGNTHARFNGTDIKWTHGQISELKSSPRHPVFWLHRGLCALDRRKYIWLGGFDGVYDPLYMEDIDLSYRAWKVGWSCLLAVDSQVSHHHHLNTPFAGEAFLRTIVRRNQYVFFWKNINDLSVTSKQIWRSVWTRVRRASAPSGAIGEEIRSLFGAVERLPRVVAGRIAMSRSTVRSDREVFALTAGIGQESCENRGMAQSMTTAAGPTTEE